MQPENQDFDAAAFMAETIDAEFDTEIIPIPEGEHLGQIGTGPDDVKVSYGISPKNNKPWMRADIRIRLTDPNLAQQLQREEVWARYSLMLDLNENGKLDTRPQRNVNLGKLRAAVGQNIKGQPWAWSMLNGQAVKVKIKQRKADDGTDTTYSDVKAVTKAS